MAGDRAVDRDALSTEPPDGLRILVGNPQRPRCAEDHLPPSPGHPRLWGTSTPPPQGWHARVRSCLFTTWISRPCRRKGVRSLSVVRVGTLPTASRGQTTSCRPPRATSKGLPFSTRLPGRCPSARGRSRQFAGAQSPSHFPPPSSESPETKRAKGEEGWTARWTGRPVARSEHGCRKTHAVARDRTCVVPTAPLGRSRRPPLGDPNATTSMTTSPPRPGRGSVVD